jgi:hypothetical protein
MQEQIKTTMKKQDSNSKFMQIRSSKGTSKFSTTNNLQIILNETRCKEKIMVQVS